MNKTAVHSDLCAYVCLALCNCQSTDFQVQQNLGNIQRICISCTCFTTWDAIMAGCYFAYCLLLLEHVPALVPSARLFIERATVVVCCYLLVLIIDGACMWLPCTRCISCPCGRSDLYLVAWSFSCRRRKQLR